MIRLKKVKQVKIIVCCILGLAFVNAIIMTIETNPKPADLLGF